jgi:hypothetical protein
VGEGGVIGGVKVEEELDKEWSRSKGGGGAQSLTAMGKMMETPVV